MERISLQAASPPPQPSPIQGEGATLARCMNRTREIHLFARITPSPWMGEGWGDEPCKYLIPPACVAPSPWMGEGWGGGGARRSRGLPTLIASSTRWRAVGNGKM